MQHIFTGDAVYAPPVLRAPSPSSSIGTDYGPDETPFSDLELSSGEFQAKVEEELALNQPRPEEEIACLDPLLRKPLSPQEEKDLYTKVMHNLRSHVRKLQEDEMFERTILRGTQVAEEQPPSSSDVDAIMRSLMGPPVPSRAPTEPPGSPIPSNPSFVSPLTRGTTSDTSATSRIGSMGKSKVKTRKGKKL